MLCLRENDQNSDQEKKFQEMFWWLLHLRGNIGQRSNPKSVNWSRTGRPILRGGARLLSTRRGAFVMKGAREQRLLWLPRASAATLCGKEHVVGFCAVNFTPNLHSPAQGETITRSTRFCRASVSYSILRKICLLRRQKSVKRSWTQTMTERTKPPVRGMAASCSPPFSLSSLT